MDVNALRVWGMAVSAALMAGALVIAARDGSASAQAPSLGVAQFAQAAAPASLAFLVRFRGEGPIARAQALAGRGDTGQAGRQITTQLARQDAFEGLCFDRFTAGASEVVLRSCEPVAAGERAAVQAQWLARLRAMRAVAYVDANATVSPERAPG